MVYLIYILNRAVVEGIEAVALVEHSITPDNVSLSKLTDNVLFNLRNNRLTRSK